MPTYEYKREDGTTFEIWQGINDDPLEECPETGQKVRRLISGGGGVVYKGEGFYVTDYKRNNEKKSNGAEKSEAGSSSDNDGESSTSNASSNGNSESKSSDSSSSE